MRIIFTGLKYYEYNPTRGLSFEYASFLPALRDYPGLEVIDFPYDEILKLGKAAWNEKMLELIKSEKPDLLFVFPYTDELSKNTLMEAKKYTKTFAWFSDDHWRFDNYSRFLAPHFDAIATTYSKAVEKYHRLGLRNVIHTQWAALGDTKDIKDTKISGPDVSFVGSWSRPRQKIISALQKAGLNPYVAGAGWPNPKGTADEMTKIFSSSKINLGLNEGQGFFNFNSLGRLFLKRSRNSFVPSFNFFRNLQSFFKRNIRQIKARHFEIPACGGFLLTSKADNLSDYYVPGKEIVLYEGPDDLIKKIHYYLANDSEREAIAKAGFERTANEHTYEQRFRKIFQQIKLL